MKKVKQKTTAIVKLMTTARALERGDLYPEGAEADFSYMLDEYVQDLGKESDSLPCVEDSNSRIPWNKGKRKPVTDDCGNEWCNCIDPNLTSNAGGRGQAYCLKCGTPWYH